APPRRAVVDAGRIRRAEGGGRGARHRPRGGLAADAVQLPRRRGGGDGGRRRRPGNRGANRKETGVGATNRSVDRTFRHTPGDHPWIAPTPFVAHSASSPRPPWSSWPPRPWPCPPARRPPVPPATSAARPTPRRSTSRCSATG